MKPTDPMSIGEALKEFFDHRQTSRAHAEGQAKDIWRSVAGSYVAGFTEDVFLREGVLHLKITSGAARSEIHIRRRFYIEKMNEALGKGAVKSIVLR